MASSNGKESGEFTQIIILTLFITSGFLAVGCLVLGYFVPERESEAAGQTDDMMALVTQLRKKEVVDLRNGYLAFKEEATTDVSLRDILLRQKGPIEFTQFGNVRPQTEGGTVVYSQPVSIREMPLQEVVSFIGRVRTAHNAVKTSRILLNRRTRGRRSGEAGGDQADPWNADVTFTLYRNEKILEKYLPNRAGGGGDPAGGTSEEAGG